MAARPAETIQLGLVLLLAGAVLHADVARAGGGAPGHTFSLLSYNVHGLFPLAAKDHPRDRMPTIGWLANKYDVVLYQEDFEYHHILAEQMEDSVGYRGNGMGWDPRRVAAKIFLSPVAVFLPHFSPPYGDGASTFADEAFAPADVAREPYAECNGWFGQNGDCWARKGFLRVRLRTPGGGEIDVYNTHLEAGPSERSVAVRSSQLDELAEAVERLSAGRAVIVAGDFNIALIRTGDRPMKLRFRERLGLEDSGAGAELPFWRERDFVLFRSGAGTNLSVEESGEAVEFVSRGRALSDHPALYVRFRVEVAAE
jgi:endonuclease/exonuclease/phosphatase family metal-dependent hydrolase